MSNLMQGFTIRYPRHRGHDQLCILLFKSVHFKQKIFCADAVEISRLWLRKYSTTTRKHLNDLHEVPSPRTRRKTAKSYSTDHRSSNPTIPEACKPSVAGVVAPEDAGSVFCSIGTVEMRSEEHTSELQSPC